MCRARFYDQITRARPGLRSAYSSVRRSLVHPGLGTGLGLAKRIIGRPGQFFRDIGACVKPYCKLNGNGVLCDPAFSD